MSQRTDSAGRWREIVRRQAGSGLSIAAFCRRSGISQATFYAWRRKLRDAVAFTEVHVSREPVPATGALELILPDGRSIVVRPGFDRATLLALLDVLEGCAAQDGTAEIGACHAAHSRRESGA